MDTSKYRITKTYISRTNSENAVKRITEAALNGEGGYVCVTNMRMVEYACETPEYNQLMMCSMMNWPDGKPLSWCGKIWGLSDVRCTRGPNVFKMMLEKGDKRLKHFMIGDTQDVLDEITSSYGETANIVGAFSPPFCSVEEFDYEGIKNKVQESGANIVWTALTAPKQDIFNAKMSQLMPNIVFVGVGRAFRMSIGKIKDAPEWAQKMGVGGMFIGKSKWYVRTWHYIYRFFRLMWYFMEIINWRIKGKKYYE